MYTKLLLVIEAIWEEDEMKNYKHKITGIVARLPETYGDLFPEVLVEVDEEENCTTCVIPEAPEPEIVPAEVTEKIRPVALPARAKEEK